MLRWTHTNGKPYTTKNFKQVAHLTGEWVMRIIKRKNEAQTSFKISVIYNMIYINNN